MRTAGNSPAREPGRKRWPLAMVFVPVLLALLAGLAACRPSGPRPPRPAAQDAPRPIPAALPREAIIFLHDRDFGVTACRFIAEEVGGTNTPGKKPPRGNPGANAVMDLAEQARDRGGNVVLLPFFRREFGAGELTGMIYRCGARQRGQVFRRASKAQQVTVITVIQP